jgi:Ca2+-binding RTX toxin-like protein
MRPAAAAGPDPKEKAMRTIRILTLGAAAVATGAIAFSAGPASAANIGGSHLDDVLYGTSYADTIEGFEGNDSLYGYAGADYIYGGSGYDYLDGADGRDRLYGGTYGDYLAGGGGPDRLFGGDASDTLVPGFGPDAVRGGYGDDYFYVYADGNADLIKCGPGYDTVYYDSTDPGDEFYGCDNFIAV